MIIYTDGSCHTNSKIGAWASMIRYQDENIQLSGYEYNTTHNRMELLAVINSISYAEENFSELHEMNIFTDSQYVAGVPRRALKLANSGYRNSKGVLLPNHDLLRILKAKLELFNVSLIKVKAHQKKGETENFNRQVDLLVRKLLRAKIKNA